MASTPRVTSASRAVGAPSTRGGTPLEVALRDWLSELRLSNRSQTSIDWYRGVKAAGASGENAGCAWKISTIDGHVYATMIPSPAHASGADHQGWVSH
jgi:hypothetical protein